MNFIFSILPPPTYPFFSVLPGADEVAKSIAPDMVVNQVASDSTKEVTTDAPLEPQWESGASIQLFFIIITFMP